MSTLVSIFPNFWAHVPKNVILHVLSRVLSLPLVHRFFSVDNGHVLAEITPIIAHCRCFLHQYDIAETCSLNISFDLWYFDGSHKAWECPTHHIPNDPP